MLTQKLGRMRVRSVQTAILAVFGVLSLSLLIPLWVIVTDRLNEMQSARRDNVIWTITQLEVEYLELEKAILVLELNGPEMLPELHRRFNVFYSRVGTLRQSPLYRTAITEAGEAANLELLQVRLERLLPLMDGHDAELMSQLGVFRAQVAAMRTPIQRIVKNGNFVLVTRIEEARKETAVLVRRLGVASLVLFGSLFGAAVLYARLFAVYKRRAKENLQTSLRLSTVISTSPDAIIVADSAGGILDFNDAAERLFGVEHSHAIGQRIAELVRPDTDEADVLPEREKNFFRRRMAGQRQDGSTVPLEVSQGSTAFERRRVYVYFLRDITERLQSEAALQASLDKARAGERAKAHFLAVMSHEMRTPLNGILGVVDLMRDSVTTEKDRHYLALLEKSGQVLLEHVNEVLDITAIEAQGITLNVAPFHLDPLLEELISTFTPVAKARGNRLELSCSPEVLGYFQGDLMRLRQIIANLLSNAIKFTENGRIDLVVSACPVNGGQEIEIQVADTGVGIPEENQAYVFDDFVRVGRGRASQVEGTGLGLGIVRRIVTAMGGQVGLDSIKGEGSLFWVRLVLPEAQAQAVETVIETDQNKDLRPMEILMVEDNPTNRFVLREMLEQDGHFVTEAENGKIGAELAQDRHFDTILMDINMPVMGGVEATRLIRAGGASKDVRIIALTAHVLDQDTQFYREVGMNGVVSKPISRRNIRRVLGGKTARTEDGRRSRTLDRVVLSQLCKTLPSDRMAHTISGVLTEGDDYIAALEGRSALTQEEVLDMTHTFAGSCAIMGATRLRNTLARLEETLRRQQDVDLNPWIAPLQTLWRETRAELEDFTAEIRGNRKG